MKNKLIAGLLSATLITSTALAHTNSIGYVGDGQGGLTFWYGSWHDNTQFNEAEIKIINPDGTSSIAAFDLLSQDSPAGLISGVNFFGSDGTQLVPYDPQGQHPMGMPMESYTWQGINYAGLQPGAYTFVYIPLGDPESNLPGFPTAEWMPMDEVIRSLSVTITQGDLDGDANNNGILDVEEVSAGDASGGPVAPVAPQQPTIVSHGQSIVVGHVVVTEDKIQIVQTTTTISTWHNMSDGTQHGMQTSSNTEEVSGSIGQMDNVKDIVSSNIRNLDYDGISILSNNNTTKDGMEGATGGIVVGTKLETDSGISLTGGFGTLKTEIKKDGDTAGAKTNILALGVGKTINNIEASAIARYAMTDYGFLRTFDNYVNGATTSGTDMAITAKFVATQSETFKPYVGFTYGKTVIDGYTEEGSALTARTVDKEEEIYKYGTIGANIDLDLLSLNGEYNSDGVKTIGVGIGAEKDKFSWNVGISRTLTELGESNKLSAGLSLKF